MKNALALAILLRAIVAVNPAESNATAPAVVVSREGFWNEDLDFFARELPSRHLDFFKLIPKKEYEEQVLQLRRVLAQLSDAEIILQLKRLVAGLGVAHTHVGWPPARSVFRPYPMTFFWYSDGLGVLAAAPEYHEAIGARVVRIGSKTPEQLEAAVAPYIASENESGLHAESPTFLHLVEVLQHLNIADADGRAHFSFIKRDGQPLTLRLAPSSSDSPPKLVIAWEALNLPTPLCHRHSDRPYWYEFLPDTKALYLHYRECRNATDYPFKRFVKEAMICAESNRVQRVVVDLRDNGGGDSEVVKPLIRALRSRPGLIAPERLYVLSGRGTFSSGMWAALELRNELRAILVGEPTGGKPNAYGNSPSFQLPHSKISVWYCTKKFRLIKNADPSSVEPDIAVPLSLNDFLAGRDPALETALHYVP